MCDRPILNSNRYSLVEYSFMDLEITWLDYY